MAGQLQSNYATIVWLLQIDVIVFVFHSNDGSCARRFYVYMRAIRQLCMPTSRSQQGFEHLWMWLLEIIRCGSFLPCLA